MKKATIEDLEIGNAMFGNSRGAYVVEPREDYQEVFQVFLERNNFDGYGYKRDSKERVFENDVFIIRPYYWGDNEEEARLPNFVYKPSGLEIKWYKYPMRDAYSNQDVNIKTFKTIIEECSESLGSHKRKIVEKIIEIYEDELTDLERNAKDIVRCKDCSFGVPTKDREGNDVVMCLNDIHPYNWYCADGVKMK